jgi:hypothetical protein
MIRNIPFRRKVLSTLCVGISVLSVSCGNQAANPRVAIQSKIARDLVPAYKAGKFACLRLPPHGPETILVVEDHRELPAAQALLRRYHINGDVESRSEGEYETGLADIQEELVKLWPQGTISANNIGTDRWYASITCPKVRLAIGPKSKAQPAVVKWARRAVAHYGSDRVSYGYYFIEFVGPGEVRPVHLRQ